MPSNLNKHQQKTEATRRKLLSAALKVFAREGFERSRLEDIAAEAGHTRGAFYANFTGKEDLFIALLEQQAGKRVAEISRMLELHTDPVERRNALREFYLRRTKDRPWAMLTLEFKLYALRHSKQRAQLAAAHQRIRDSFHVGILNRLKSGTATGQANEYCATESQLTESQLTENLVKVLLEILLCGLVLEHSYDPKRISAEQVNCLLGRMFDLLVDEKSRLIR